MSELNNAIKGAMIAMLIKFNNRLNRSQMESEAKLADWAEFLAFEKKFTVSQVAHALTELTKANTKFMPSAYEIAEALAPKAPNAEDMAALIVDEVINKTLYHGFYQTEKAFEELSPDAQRVAGNGSFLREVCNCPPDQLNTFKAQLRRLAKATLESDKASKVNAQLQRVGIDTSKVLRFSDKMDAMRRIGAEGFHD